MKTVTRSFITLTALWMAFGGAHAQAQTLQPIDRIIAVVEDDIVLRSELDRALGPVHQQLAANHANIPEDVVEKQVLERLLMEKLQLQRAESTGIRISDGEVDNSIAMMAQRNQITPSDLRRNLEKEGIAFSRFRADVRKQLILQTLHSRYLATQVNILESEVDIELKKKNTDQGEYHLAHILIAASQSASPEELKKAREKADKVLAELDQGTSFEKAAITYSNGQQALEGGDLGWRPLDQMPTDFMDTIRELKPGAHSGVLRSPAGFHILKLLGYREKSIKIVEERKARHIMIEVSEMVDDATALQLAQEARARIVDNGEDFATVARDVSDDKTTAELGGMLDWFLPGSYGARVEQVLDHMEINDISQPFRTVAGWHIIQLLGKRKQDVTEKLQRDRAREAIRARKGEEAFQLWLRQMRDESFVDIRLKKA